MFGTTSTLLNAVPLLADSRIMDLGSRFRRNSSTGMSLWQLLSLAAIIGLVGLVAWFVHKSFERHGALKETSPRYLFHELCRAHSLGILHMLLLYRVARRLRLAQPAMVFIDRSHLDDVLQRREFRSSRRTLRKLQEKLFGTESNEPNEV